MSLQVARLSIEDFLEVVVRRVRGEEAVSVMYTALEELRLATSVLFTFLRRDVEDEKVARELRAWTDRMVAAILQQATLYDHLFLLNHIMRCPAGVGRCG